MTPPAEPSPPAPWPWADRVAWAALAVGAAGLLAELARYWGANPAYADRMLVVGAAAWAAWQAGPRAKSSPVRPRPALGLTFVLLAAVLLPLAWYLRARVGPRVPLLWWQYVALASGAVGLLLTRGGWGRAKAFRFPLAFPVFALPIPGLVLHGLQEALQGFTTGAASAALTGLGLEVERAGYVLRLPSGDLGVAEACSGVRSLTALTALAGFVGYSSGFGPLRGVLLVGLSVPVVVAVNVFRVVLTGLIQESAGTDYVQGGWHEALGFAAVFVGLGLILLEAQLLGGPAVPSPALPDATPAPVGRTAWLAAGMLTVGVAAAGVAAALGGVAAAAGVAAAPPLAEIPLTLGRWHGRDVDIPAGVSELLVPDAALYRVYADNLGQEMHVWVVYWAEPGAMKGRHDPDVCWPSRGFERTELWPEAVPLPDGGDVPATARVFRRAADRQHQFLLYWVQDGSRVQTDARPTTAADHQQWVPRFLGLEDAPAEPRLMVLVGTPTTTPRARAEAVAFTGQFAAALYSVCPPADVRRSKFR